MGILLILLRNVRIRNERGSITLEAAIAVPLLLTFIIALGAFIRLSMMEAGLRSAVSQAAHQLAVQAYPLHLLTESMSRTELVRKLNEWHDKAESGKTKVEDWLEEYGELIPAPLSEAVRLALDAADQLEEELTEPVRAAFQPLVAHYLPRHMEGDRLRVSALSYPLMDKDGEPMVKLEAEYEAPIRVPFVSRTVTLRAAAWERLWIGDER